MKTKILSILALLLTVTQGAWAQVGRVLAADGKYYKTVTAATNAGTTASGMIVYWGDGDTSDNTYNQGLVIALSDVVNNGQGQWGAKQQDVTGITDTGSNAASSMVDLRGIANTDAIVSEWPTGTYSYAANHCASMSTARPSSSSDWFLPSQGQFVLMMNSFGAGYGTSTNYAYDNITKGAVVTAINKALNDAGGTALSNGRYWTSTEINKYSAGDWSASNSSFGYNDKPSGHYVRAMFAFTSATPAYIVSVSYDANGGSGAPSAQTKDFGIDLTLSSTVPTREGYTFVGWNTAADGSGTSYAAGATYTTDDDATLYAQWLMTAMIGCEGMVIAANGKMYKTLAAANKYSTASGIVAYYGSEVVETGQTYKAIAISLTDLRYNPDYMIYCSRSGSCSGHTYGDLATALTVKDGIATQATALTTNANHGYSHQVAFAVRTSTPLPEGASAWVCPSIGQWNLIMKGLTGSNSNLSTSANAAFSVSNVNAKLPTDATGFSQTIYWSNTEKDNSNMWTMQFNGSGGYAGNIAKNTGTKTYCRGMFAFTSATPAYIVSYDANGGSGAPDEQVRDGGTSLTLSSTVPTREGYAFAGWNTAADGSGASYAAGDAYTTDDDVTLYAQWAPAYTVTVKEGTEDAANWQGKAGEGEYQALPLEGVAAGTAVSVKYNGTKKVKSVKAVKKPDLLSGVFSVSASKKVKFSKGNLRYASGTWSFFNNQYDYYTSYSADAWDHFGWSTSATTYGMNTSTSSSTYSGNFVDWGSNSDLQTALGTGWFTLSSAESTYLFNERSASTVGGTSNGRYAKAKVNNVYGVILFPDTYTHPDGVTAPVGVNAGDATGWNGNNYTIADWTKMESAGCVFLPGAGYRDGESLVSTGIFGAYWSATSNGADNAYDFVYYYSGYLAPAFTNTRNLGFSVRLVQEVAPTY